MKSFPFLFLCFLCFSLLYIIYERNEFYNASIKKSDFKISYLEHQIKTYVDKDSHPLLSKH